MNMVEPATCLTKISCSVRDLAFAPVTTSIVLKHPTRVVH
jgi:hypothetical protein